MQSLVPNHVLSRNVAKQLENAGSMDYHRARKTALLCKECGTVQRVTATAGKDRLRLACNHTRPYFYRRDEDVQAIEKFSKRRKLLKSTARVQVFESDIEAA